MDRSQKTRSISWLTMGAIAVLAGCTYPTSPEIDSRFGVANRSVRAQQIIDPAAPTKNTTLAPVDGKAAASAHRNYADSYKAKAGPVNTEGTGK
jgi:hypothetical protein